MQATVVRWLSLIELLESVKRSYKQIKKVLMKKNKIFVLDKSIISQLIRLLQPFRHVMVVVQKGKAPSLHLVTIAILTFRRALHKHTSVIKYSKHYEMNSSTQDESEDEEGDEQDIEVSTIFLLDSDLLNHQNLNWPIRSNGKYISW